MDRVEKESHTYHLEGWMQFLEDEGVTFSVHLTDCDFEVDHWYPYTDHYDRVNQNKGASAILVSDIRKSPHIAQTNSKGRSSNDK